MNNQPRKQRGPDEPWIPKELMHLAYLAKFPEHKTEAEAAAFLRQRLTDFRAHREELEQHGSYPAQLVDLMDAAVTALEHRLRPADNPEEHELQNSANDADVLRLGMALEGRIIEHAYEKEPWNEEKRAQKEAWDEMKKNFPKEP